MRPYHPDIHSSINGAIYPPQSDLTYRQVKDNRLGIRDHSSAMPDTADAHDISRRSHWLRQALRQDASVAPTLSEAITADICIVGGGYLGLWTAIHLKDSEPSVDVIIIEQDICGGGPSGRNSGMLLSAWP